MNIDSIYGNCKPDRRFGSKVSDKVKQSIYRDHLNGVMNQTELAKYHNVSESVVSTVINAKPT